MRQDRGLVLRRPRAPVGLLDDQRLSSCFPTSRTLQKTRPQHPRARRLRARWRLWPRPVPTYSAPPLDLRQRRSRPLCWPAKRRPKDLTAFARLEPSDCRHPTTNYTGQGFRDFISARHVDVVPFVVVAAYQPRPCNCCTPLQASAFVQARPRAWRPCSEGCS